MSAKQQSEIAQDLERLGMQLRQVRGACCETCPRLAKAIRERELLELELARERSLKVALQQELARTHRSST